MSRRLAVRHGSAGEIVHTENLRKVQPVALWLVLIIAGLVVLVLGLAGLGQFFIYAGLIAAVVGVVLVLVGRGDRVVGRR